MSKIIMKKIKPLVLEKIIVRRLNKMNTKIISVLLLGILMTSFMAVGVLAQNSNPQTNDCMKDATQKKNADFKGIKETYRTALDQAKLISDKEDKKAALEQARADLKTAKKVIKATFKTDRKACLALKK